MIEHINSNNRMSQVVRAGNIAWLAGQIPQDTSADIKGQTREVLDNIDAILQNLGGSKANLTQVQIWLETLDDVAGMNAVWDDWVDPAHPPARATCAVGLVSAKRGVRIEVLATAAL